MATLFGSTDATVEIAFGDAPLETSPTWVDVTGYVRDLSISRGRSSEFSTYGPGNARIVLDNRDRRFDPAHVSSPYAGDLVPMVPIRVTAQYGAGSVHTVFSGFILGWPTQYDRSNSDAVTTVQAIDGTRILSNSVLPSNAYSERVLEEDPWLYFPGQSTVKYQPPGYTTFWDTVQSHDGAAWMLGGVSNNMAVNSYQYPAGASNGWDELIDTRWRNGYLGNPTIDVPSVTGLEFWWQGADVSWTSDLSFTVRSTHSGTNAHDIIMLLYFDYSADEWLIYQSRFYSDDLSLYGQSFTPVALTTVSDMNHMLMTWDGGSALRIYVNGSLASTVALSGSGSVSPSYDTEIAVNPPTFPRRVDVSHIAVHTSAISTGGAIDHYNAGIGYTPELSSVRLGRVLDDANWPAAWRDIDTGVQTVNEYLPDRASALRYFDQIVNAEQGELTVNRLNHVEMRNRTRAETSIPVAYFDPDSGDLPFVDVQVDGSSVDTIRNYVVVQYKNGDVVSTDAVSVDAYGAASEVVNAGLIDSGSSAKSIADVRLARRKDPQTRITRLDVDVRDDESTLVDTMAPLDLADDVVVAFTPTGVGDPLWRAVRVQGISHQITPSSWTVSLYLAPGSTNTNGPLWVLDHPVYGRLDAGNKLG